MNLRSLENGTHPACGRSAVRRERSRPSRAAASKMARSTGSMPAPGALACAGARLAISAWPIMPRVASVACAGPPDGSELSWPAVHVRTTAMSPDVRVRVLSVQMTVVDPSDSTAGRRRTSAFRAAIRCRPTASAIVATAGSASGTAATASAIAGLDHDVEGNALQGSEAGDNRGDAERQPDKDAAERIEAALERCGFELDASR